MKKKITYILLVFTILSCSKESKEGQSSETYSSSNSNSEISQKGKNTKGDENDAESLDNANSHLNDLFKMGQGLLENSDTQGTDGMQLDPEMILELLEKSGVSREEMEKLLNNPDSLDILLQEAKKNRQAAQQNEPPLKGKISKEQLASKNTKTGVSLEEAILIVQAESGPEATTQKLKKIDSLAGTNVMSQLDLTDAGYVMTDVERKNEVKVSPEEERKIETLKKLSGQLHSDKESEQLLTELEKTEEDIASGKLKVSPKYQRAIKHRKKIVKVFKNDFTRKAKAAKKKFQDLNPDLYFGEEIGATYVGHMRKAVYLPLGKLSFADKVVKANHPKLMTQQVKNVIGEPDVIKGFLAEDITGIHSLGLGGSLTIQFIDNALTNVNGPDLYIFEIGQIEPTDLEISKDGRQWIKVGKIDGGVAEVDIAPFVKQGELFYYVRLKDLKKQSALPGADVDAIAAIGAAVRLNLDSKVLFETGKAELKSEGIKALKKLAESISILKKGNVIVEGHTDDIGSADSNQKLSLARAKSVSAELKKLIPSKSFRWSEKGLGESKPLVENDSDVNRAKNRRVEVLVVPN